MAKTLKEDISSDLDEVKALKRKTRKVLKDPTKAGEVADDLASDGVDAPEGTDNGQTTDDNGDEGLAPDGDEGNVEPGPGDETGDEELQDEHPDLGTFLEQAIANSKEAIVKYEKQLAEMKEKVKSMGIEIPGLLDPEDVSDEETPEEFPPEVEPPDDGAGLESAEGGEGDGIPGGDEGAEGEVPAGDEGGEPPPEGDEGGAPAEGGPNEGTGPIPTKKADASIAAPAKVKGTKLK